jgi:ribosome-associated protein
LLKYCAGPAEAVPVLGVYETFGLGDQRISKDGVVIIKAQKFRSLEKNRAEALRRLEELIAGVAEPPKPRRPTKPTRASIARRGEDKARRATVKARRGKVLAW